MTTPETDAVTGNELVRDGAYLLDVRNLDEWDAGHAPDAVFIPMPQVAERDNEVPRDRRIVVICRSGARSAKVTDFLCAQGFDAVNLAGGMRAWAAAALPVVTDTGNAGTVI